MKELENAKPLERLFYTASMIIMKEQETKNQIALAKLTNPFISEK